MCVCDGVCVSCDPQQTVLLDPEIRTLAPPLGTGGGEKRGGNFSFPAWALRRERWPGEFLGTAVLKGGSTQSGGRRVS